MADGKATEDAASGWLICAIAEQLAGMAVGTGCRSTGPPCIEMLSWPNAVYPGDDLELKIEILERHLSRSGSSALVRWRWVLATYQGKKVLDLVSATLIEDRAVDEKTPGVDAPIAYKVSKAAAMVGISRYLLYDAIRHRELRAYRPNARSDLMILPEDLREWVTPRIASAKMLPDGIVASREMLPAMVTATMLPPRPKREGQERKTPPRQQR